MKVIVVERLTQHEVVLDEVTVVEIGRREIMRPSMNYNFAVRVIETVLIVYSRDLVVGTFPIDEYAFKVMSS